MIYFIQGQITKRIKIGHTNAMIEERMQPMISSSPDKLKFLGGMSGDTKLEKYLHNKFKEFFSHGEWYNDNDSIITYINNNCIKNIEYLEIINAEVLNGKLSFEEALKMSEDEIIAISREHISYAYKNLFKKVKLPDFNDDITL